MLRTHPLFAFLLMHLSFVADNGIKKISTNGKCIFFNPDFLQRLAPNELDSILCHQVLHITTGHIFRTKEYAGDAFHYACDEEIKSYLIALGFDEGSYKRLSKEFQYDKANNRVKNVYEAYSRINYWFRHMEAESTSKFIADSDKYWDLRSSDVEDGILILDSDSYSSHQKPDVSISGVGTATGTSRARGETDMSDREQAIYIRKLKDSLKQKSELDWRVLLDAFVQEQITDYSFLPPDARFADSDFMLPDFNDKEFLTKDILFMVDTSGSVEDEMLSAAYVEISSAIEQFNGGLRGRLGFFDCKVYGTQPFENITDLFSVQPVGGGGTNFIPIFKYINDQMETLPSCLVVITDGKGQYPPSKEASNIPVLWIINNDEVTPPFGKVVRIKKK